MAAAIEFAAEFAGLLGFSSFGPLHTFVASGPYGLGISIGKVDLSRYGYIPVDTLTTGQRFLVGGLAAACWTSNILAVVQLRGLFALYSRGVVFSTDNIARIKKFGFWVAVTAVVANVSGRLFVRVLHGAVLGIANAAEAVVIGAMIYVIGYVMELAREADLERKEFV